MNQKFRGWNEVGRHLREMAQPSSTFASLLNDGQRASLVALADRIARNGVIVADEVGMGKTRIAVFLAMAVAQSGGRSAVVIPPGLSFQWRKEFSDCGTEIPDVVRSLHGYFQAWDTDDDQTGVPWFDHQIIMISHLFSNWRLGPNSQPWRWCLLPEVYAAARKAEQGRVPRGYHNAYSRDGDVKRVAAAAHSITQAVLSKANAPDHALLTKLYSEIGWQDSLDPEKYGKHKPPSAPEHDSNKKSLREWLGGVVGLGLGTFNLVIIDEAHKNRRKDGGLSTVLANIILQSSDCRRLALTATPIELDVRQWVSTLERLATTEEQRKPIIEATERYAEAIRRLRLIWRTNSDARDEYRDAASQFQKMLAPYLLRRDKRQDDDVLAFKNASGQSEYDYRYLREVAIELDDLDPLWRQVVCAAEALSVIREPAVNVLTRRLRLTVGNGHGLASVIDEAFRDESADRKQIEDERNRTKDEEGATGPNQDVYQPVVSRSAWWVSVLRNALSNDPDVLFNHPAIQAAVRTIEAETERGEKVLVFGRFTRPMRDLVNLLNARQMLRAVENKNPWPQSKVHQYEWSAVRAAKRQLSSKLDLDKLDDILAKRYTPESAQHEDLLSRLRTALVSEHANRKCLAIVNAIERSSANAIRDDDNNEHPIALLARAIDVNTDIPGATPSVSDAYLARAFHALVDAARDHDSSDDDELDEELAEQIWEVLKRHLQENYTSQRGRFARLMYGETKSQARRMIQLAFNRRSSFPRVLVAQSLVGREGLNLHESCRIVVLLHPEWNPGVVEQQIGRVDRVNSRWATELRQAIADGRSGKDLPRIEIRPIIFKGTYDEHNWNVLQERWDDLRAQLHGEALPTRLRANEDEEGQAILDEIVVSRPNFSPA